MNLELCTLFFLQEDYKFTFKEEIINDQSRYYVESDGSKFYLMVQSNEIVTTLPGSDLVIGSLNDQSTTFRTVQNRIARY